MSDGVGVDGSSPAVSVVVCTFNYGEFIGEAVQSVVDQTFVDWDLIVVDDGSTDCTGEVVGSFTDRRIRYVYQENRGAAAARNRAIGMSKAPYVALLDADDIWVPRKLEFQISALESSSDDVALLYSDAHRFWHPGGEILRPWITERTPPRGRVFDKLLRRNFIPAPTVVMKRSAIDQVGLFDESLRFRGDDLDMWLRVAWRYEIECLDEPLAWVRVHLGSWTRDTANMTRVEAGVADSMLVLDRAVSRGPLSGQASRWIRRRRASLEQMRGRGYLCAGEGRVARRALAASIRLNPWDLRTYAYHAVSWGGPTAFRMIRAAKRRLTRPLVLLRGKRKTTQPPSVGRRRQGEPSRPIGGVHR